MFCPRIHGSRAEKEIPNNCTDSNRQAKFALSGRFSLFFFLLIQSGIRDSNFPVKLSAGVVCGQSVAIPLCKTSSLRLMLLPREKRKTCDWSDARKNADVPTSSSVFVASLSLVLFVGLHDMQWAWCGSRKTVKREAAFSLSHAFKLYSNIQQSCLCLSLTALLSCVLLFLEDCISN